MATLRRGPGCVSNTSRPRSADSAAMKAGIIWHPPITPAECLLASCAGRVGPSARHRIIRLNSREGDDGEVASQVLSIVRHKPGSTVSVSAAGISEGRGCGLRLEARRRLSAPGVRGSGAPQRAPMGAGAVGEAGCRRPWAGWVGRRSWPVVVRWGTARSVAGPAPAGTGAPMASGSASAGAIAALSGSAGRAGPDSGSAASWW